MLKPDDLIKMWQLMNLTRLFEELQRELFINKKITEMNHPSKGQEAVGVGVTYGLEVKDSIIPSLRTRAAFFTKGVSIETMMLALLCKKDSPSGGRQTSHHLGIPELNIVVGSGILGGALPVAVGLGLASKLSGDQAVSVVFFGDGASNRGEFHESLNFAAVTDAPVIFVCENNAIAFSTRPEKYLRIDNIAIRAKGYGIPGLVADGQDVIDVHAKTQEALKHARSGLGPVLLECKTEQFLGHTMLMDPLTGRTTEELQKIVSRDPVAILGKKIMEEKIATESELEEQEKNLRKEVQTAYQYALEQDDPLPESAVEELMA